MSCLVEIRFWFQKFILSRDKTSIYQEELRMSVWTGLSPPSEPGFKSGFRGIELT